VKYVRPVAAVVTLAALGLVARSLTATTPPPTWTQVAGYEYTTTQLGALPQCLGDPSCFALCTFTDAGWGCIGNDGGSVGVVTNNGNMGAGTFAPGLLALRAVQDSDAPSATGLEAWLGGDQTFVMGGFTRSNTETGTIETPFTLANVSDYSNVFATRAESGLWKCNWIEGGNASTSNVTNVANNLQPRDGWSISSCRRHAGQHRARSNGQNGEITTSDTSPGVTAGAVANFGRAQSTAPGLEMNGPLAFVALYTESKSDVWMNDVEQDFSGAPFAYVGGGIGQVVGLDDGQDVNFFQSGGHLVAHDFHDAGIRQGLRVLRGIIGDEDGGAQSLITNYWADDALNVASWDDVGSPGVAPVASAGPFSRYLNSLTAYRLTDDDSCAFEGKSSGESVFHRAVPEHYYTASCYLSAGTTMKARLEITSDGSGGGACDFTDLDSTPRRVSCTRNIKAGSTVHGRVLVGTQGSDTGSIIVYQCQMTPESFAEMPNLDRRIPIGSSYDALNANGWPTTGRAKYEEVFCPLYDFNSEWDHGVNTLWPFDIQDSNGTSIAGVALGDGFPGLITATTRDGGGEPSYFTAAGYSSEPSQCYAISLEWELDSDATCCPTTLRYDVCASNVPLTACHASTAIASHMGVCPGTPASMNLGNRAGATVSTSFYVAAVRVFQ
jgi:hypothetical protein